MTNQEIFNIIHSTIRLGSKAAFAEKAESEIIAISEEFLELLQKVNEIAFHLGNPRVVSSLDAPADAVIRPLQDGSSRCLNATAAMVHGTGTAARNYANFVQGLSLLTRAFSFLASRNHSMVESIL